MTARDPRFALVLALCLFLVACGGQSSARKGEADLGLDPEGSPAELYVKMAEEYYARGQTEVAYRRAQQAVEADDKYPRAHIWLAFLLEELHQADEAARHYDRAVKLAPNNSDILNAYASFLCRQRKYAEADVHFLKAAANPVYATPWIALTNAGNCAVEAGDTRKAETHYRAAIQANGAYGAPQVNMAELALKRGDAKAAKDYIDRYFNPETARTSPSVSRTALRVGADAERKLGNRKRADYYEGVLKTSFPETPKPRDL
ncbi:type IV pilus biogenesis/stability protein PilW [Thiocystis violacea]|uniref:type IV pilus biogenesis/stability protein PilW n=1 Tax=Thiocystis violacea TaxID=13725 RepID=UPI0019090021|nr:type IV pilus biogenesis/stability protein PilW [Thiocystis violacea]MBK1717273.1 type IV pilus biogenesis/stability protein PilW [Thiocystis violacea]